MSANAAAEVSPLAAQLRHLETLIDALEGASGALSGASDSLEVHNEVLRLQNEARQLAVDLHSALGDVSAAGAGDPDLWRLEQRYGVALDRLQRAVHESAETMAGHPCTLRHQGVWRFLRPDRVVLRWLTPKVREESTSGVADDIAAVCQATTYESDSEEWRSADEVDRAPLVERRCLVPLTQEMREPGTHIAREEAAASRPLRPPTKAGIAVLSGVVSGLLVVPLAVLGGVALGPTLLVSGTGALTGTLMAAGVLQFAKCSKTSDDTDDH